MEVHRSCNHEHNRGGGDHRRTRGPSSFHMHDPEVVFCELALRPGDVFLDLGCGAGDYALYAAWKVGGAGKVYAYDRWEALLSGLEREAAVRGLGNLETKVCDICRQLDLEAHSIDVCLISTVLHAIDFEQTGESLFREIHRVLRPGGRLSVIECKKTLSPFGPPLHLRLSAEDLEAYAVRCGFEKSHYTDLGPNYMVQFIAL